MTEKTAIAIAAGPNGLQLNSIDDMWRFAKAVALSGMAPRGLEKPEALVTAMQLGAEVGMGPMTAIQNIAVINGRPTVWGDVMLGLCMSSGLFDEEAFSEAITGSEETGDWEACCSCRRLGTGRVTTHTFSIKDAKRAGLWGKAIWKQYPERMLQMRARSWALRDCFPDVLKGMYSGEEARDIVVDAVPSEDHLRQAREAREAREAEEDADVQPEALTPSEVPALTSDDEEEGYGLLIEDADLIGQLDDLQGEINANGILTQDAAYRLTARIDARKATIRASRGSRSNEPETD